MEQQLHFLWFQFKRSLRFLLEIGPFRAIFLVALVLVIFKAGFDQYLEGKHYLGLVVIPLLFSLQFARNDQSFLTLIDLKQKALYRLLYLAFSLPFLLVLGITQEWLYCLCVLLTILVLPAVPKSTFSIDKYFLNLGAFLPYKYFEWRAGLRQYGLAVVALFLVGIGLGFYVGTVPIIIFLLTLNTSVFYLHGEAKEMLLPFADKPNALLFSKLKGHLKLFAILICPLVLVFLVFNMAYWYVLVYVLVVSFIVNVNSIIFKYSSYQPGVRLDNNQILQAISMGAFLVPFLFPIPIVLSFINYRKAIVNLKKYL